MQITNFQNRSCAEADLIIDELLDLTIVCLMFARAYDLDIESAITRVVSENQVNKGMLDPTLLLKCQHLNQQLNLMLDAGCGSEEIRLRMKAIGSQDGMELHQ